jgi:tetratricopeptide (TPR) repeat protein
VALVVLGVIAFVAGTVGVKYAKKIVGPPAASAPVKDDRVRKLLEAGDTDLSRGDFESAKEQFDKASVLAEHDGAVLSALARLEAARADTRWLSIKLIDPTNKTDLEAERAELDGRLTRVRKAADAAAAAAPNDPEVLRVRIDAFRLSGDLSRARELVGTLGSDSSRPETAYVLAALDLAEPSPAWTTVVDRLRTAAAAERGFGRARAALVYALASSGALDEARAELGKLEATGPTSVLVGRLRAFVQRTTAAAPSAEAALVPSASGAAPAAALPGAAGITPAGAPGEAIPRGDFRRLLVDASAAKNAGDLTKANALYQAARDQQPGNIEALSGLADVARMRGDNATAGAYYDSVIKQNPTYLPALMASADLKWAAGDHASAVALYKRVTSQADPGSQYAQRAAARIAEGGGGRAPAPAEPRPAPEPRPTPKPAAPQREPSTPSDTNIDTSDLPGFNR